MIQGAATLSFCCFIRCLHLLQIASFLLFTFDGFEQCFEISLAEAAAPLALDDLKEKGGTVLYRAREDLQHIPLIVTIDQDAQLFQFIEWFVDGPDTRL